MDEPNDEDLARDLENDLAEHEDMAREAGIGTAFGHDPPNTYAMPVYEYARFALEALPAALRLAMHYRAEAARLKAELAEARALSLPGRSSPRPAP